eukprot:Pgem_evm1s11817
MSHYYTIQLYSRCYLYTTYNIYVYHPTAIQPQPNPTAIQPQPNPTATQSNRNPIQPQPNPTTT